MKCRNCNATIYETVPRFYRHKRSGMIGCSIGQKVATPPNESESVKLILKRYK